MNTFMRHIRGVSALAAAGCVLGLAMAVVHAQPSTATIVATVNLGGNPYAVAVDSTTGRAFVANIATNTVSVIDEATLTLVATISVGSSPRAVAINPLNHLVYVANSDSNSVSVIDGITLAVVAVVGSAAPDDVAIHPGTNRLYIASQTHNRVSVIDATTFATVGLIPAQSAAGVAVNPITNRVYISSFCCSNLVTVIDGADNTLIATVVTAEANPVGIEVNPATNRIYVANLGSNSVTVINGDNNVIATIGDVGSGPISLAVDSVANRLYVGSQFSDELVVIDGDTDAVTQRVAAGAGLFHFGVAVNQATARVYLTDAGGGTLSVFQDTPPPPSTEPFASFSAKVFRYRHATQIAATFTLGAGSNGINPTTETMVFSAGEYSATLNPGSILKSNRGIYWFNGLAGGATLQLAIVPFPKKANTFELLAQISNFAVNANPVSIGLAIGGDTGSTNAR